MGNRKWTQRDGGNGDVFGYDFNDQVTAVKLDVASPDTTQIGPQTIFYDNNGNRTDFHPYGTIETYALNNLSQYSSRAIGGVTSNAAYDLAGNLTLSPDPTAAQLACTYDAQNRLLIASKNGVTMSFAYDGLNRQVKRVVTGGPNPGTFFSVYDGWDLVQEYHMSGNTVVEDASYLYGPTGLVKNLKSGNYYYQDASGSTSHLASSSGTLLEWYRYDLQGTPYVNGDSSNHQPGYGVRHLFTGQQWYSDVGLYDLRNRFYSPDLGRFLEPDPIGFGGDRTNLYRYCGNNPLKWRDPSGLGDQVQAIEYERQIVTGGAPWGGLGDPGNMPIDVAFTDPGLAFLGASYYAGGGYRLTGVRNTRYTGINSQGQPYDLNGGQEDYGIDSAGQGDQVIAQGEAVFESAPPLTPAQLRAMFSAAQLQATILRLQSWHSRLFGGDPYGALGKYRFEVNPSKIITPVQRELHSYDLGPLGDAIYQGAGVYSIGLGVIAGGEALAGTPLANATVTDTLPYLRFIFQMIAKNEGPPPTPRLPPPTDVRPPYVQGPW